MIRPFIASNGIKRTPPAMLAPGQSTIDNKRLGYHSILKMRLNASSLHQQPMP
ncbi:MAG: hypothetical protein R2849_20990 [Thermomicrobiales bacterium]